MQAQICPTLEISSRGESQYWPGITISVIPKVVLVSVAQQNEGRGQSLGVFSRTQLG
jgi:hypothetical protein